MGFFRRNKGTTTGPKIELFLSEDGKWYFHKKAVNGKVTFTSQGYKEKRYAKEAIQRDHPDLVVVELEDK